MTEANRDVLHALAGGSAVQILVPGLYAWITTVVPPAWSRGGMPVSRVAAAAAFVALVVGWWVARRGDQKARVTSLWGFVLSSAVCWSAVPRALGPAHIDDLRGITGTFAWALFAFAWAAPAFDAMAGDTRVADDDPLTPRKRLPGSGVYILAVAALAAAVLQLIGWAVPSPERAMLVRLASLVSGLLIIEASVEVVLSRQGRAVGLGGRDRLKGSRWALAALALLAAGGAFLISKG
jgi:hypothetical protein